MGKTCTLDAVEQLDYGEVVAEYLAAGLEDGDHDAFLAALADVAEAHGMEKLVKATGVDRKSLIKMLAPGAKPPFETIMKISRALGVSLRIKGSSRRRACKA